MARANDNLINKRGTYDDSQVSTAEADIIDGQKSGLALAGPATTALKFGGIERQQHILNILEFIIVLSLKIHYVNIYVLLIIADHKFRAFFFQIFDNSPLNRMFLGIYQNSLGEAIIIINIHNI